jgi:hypothetical protein
MAGSADTYCSISQPLGAILNRPTSFTLAITNTSSTTAYTVSSISIWPTNTLGQPVASARVTSPKFPPNSVSAVAASSTLYCAFDGAFFGQAVPGIPSAAPEVVTLTAQVLYSDGSVINSSPLVVNVADPIWGLIGSPPAPTGGVIVSSLQFSTPANSGLHLMGWV